MRKLKHNIGIIVVLILLIILYIIRSQKGTNIFNDGIWMAYYLALPLFFTVSIYLQPSSNYQYSKYLISLFFYSFIMYITSGYFSGKYIDVGSITFAILCINLLFFQGGLFQDINHREIKVLSKRGIYYTAFPFLINIVIYLLNEFIIEYLIS